MPTKPKVLTKAALNRLADPIKYRYSAKNEDRVEVDGRQDLETPPVMVRNSKNGAITITINTEKIKSQNSPGKNKNISIELPAVVGNQNRNVFLTGTDNDEEDFQSRNHNQKSSFNNKLQQIRDLDQQPIPI